MSLSIESQHILPRCLSTGHHLRRLFGSRKSDHRQGVPSPSADSCISGSLIKVPKSFFSTIVKVYCLQSERLHVMNQSSNHQSRSQSVQERRHVIKQASRISISRLLQRKRCLLTSAVRSEYNSDSASCKPSFQSQVAQQRQAQSARQAGHV